MRPLSGKSAVVMEIIGWSDELALGIESIDIEHKRLLSLIAQAEAARLGGERRKAVRLLRLFLGEFGKHFEKEADLLAGMDAAAMAQRRSEYLTSQAVLQAHPLDADDIDLIEHVTVYAHAWLLDHIVRQDLPHRAAFWRRGEAPPVRRAFWQRFDVLKLRWRIALLAAVPLVALAFLVVTVVDELHHQAKSMDLLRDMNALNGDVGLLVHELQRERGLASLYMADRSVGPERFMAQVQRTDEALVRFNQTAVALEAKLAHGGAKQVLENAIVAMDLVPFIRVDVLAGRFEGIENIDNYSTAVDDLSAVVPEVIHSVLPSDFASNTLAYLFLLQAKEQAGRERAYGLAMISRGAPARSVETMYEFATKQKAYMDGFMGLAPKDLARALQVANGPESNLFMGMRARLDAGEATGIGAQEWFDAASRRIDAMNDVQSRMIARLAADASSLQEAAYRRTLWLGGGLAALLMVSCVMVAVLGWSILPPLRRIGATIQRLARGERALDVPGQEAGDELGDMARSVQSLKERLVHGDLLAARRWTENAERLRAVTDNLPGVVFHVDQSHDRQPIVTCVSRKLREVTGLPAAEVVNKPMRALLRRLLRAEDWPAVLLALHRAGAQPLDFEFRLRDTVGGRPRWLRVLASPTRTEQGWMWNGVALDVTSLKRAEEEHARMTAELANFCRSRTTSQLTRSIGRELAALVEPMADHVERAVRAVAFTDPARPEMLAVMDAAEQIRALIDRLSDMGNDARGERYAVDVVAVLTERLQAIRDLLPEHAIDSRLGGLGAHVLSTQAEMERVGAYLCSRMPADGSRLEVSAEIADDDLGRRWLRLSVDHVASTGGNDGGAPERRPFAVHQQDRDSEFSLAMTRAIVEGCGGWLDIRRQSQEGMVIEVCLPVVESGKSNVIEFRGGAKWQKTRH
ncbi:MAG: nitrate- and nitrite sensing domain-containing protein [Magnetospirillum sp.]|nr:nitrate- and nitrite sensing domain-containing protein [Magnetospirillum sp.]